MKLTRSQRHPFWNWSPEDQMFTLRSEINRLFESPFAEINRSEFFNNWAPALDLVEDKDNLVVRVEIPGMKKEDLDVSLHEGVLTIAGERKQEQRKEGEISRSERFYGRFQRTLALPKAVEVEKIKAAYKDGLLTITLPKAEEAKPRQIEVKVS